MSKHVIKVTVMVTIDDYVIPLSPKRKEEYAKEIVEEALKTDPRARVTAWQHWTIEK